jgi:hypothetical protein
MTCRPAGVVNPVQVLLPPVINTRPSGRNVMVRWARGAVILAMGLEAPTTGSYTDAPAEAPQSSSPPTARTAPLASRAVWFQNAASGAEGGGGRIVEFGRESRREENLAARQQVGGGKWRRLTGVSCGSKGRGRGIVDFGAEGVVDSRRLAGDEDASIEEKCCGVVIVTAGRGEAGCGGERAVRGIVDFGAGEVVFGASRTAARRDQNTAIGQKRGSVIGARCDHAAGWGQDAGGEIL